ncbi:hypothetical protein, partial [Coleofasciculus sp.]|uniref:hypothetical protein n=1 Tax=Coleofasciculus sp. TaxID=3100458 RepID=UPI003A1BCBEA
TTILSFDPRYNSIRPDGSKARLYMHPRPVYCDRVSFTLLSRRQLFESNALNLDGNGAKASGTGKNLQASVS